MEKHELVVNEQRVPLSPLEFSVLRYISEHTGEVVHSLRKKLEPHAALIEMVTKVGYPYRRS